MGRPAAPLDVRMQFRRSGRRRTGSMTGAKTSPAPHVSFVSRRGVGAGGGGLTAVMACLTMGSSRCALKSASERSSVTSSAAAGRSLPAIAQSASPATAKAPCVLRPAESTCRAAPSAKTWATEMEAEDDL